jgi:Double zinc ribbon
MRCFSCATENRTGTRFCVKCGQRLDRSCSACGASYTEGDEFCGQCGASLAGAVAAVPRPNPAPAGGSTSVGTAERRHVSVLFADLVGFTSLSDNRDAEGDRELLSRYFDTARTVITRYGGTVEKFIARTARSASSSWMAEAPHTAITASPKGMILGDRGRQAESMALTACALDHAVALNLHTAALVPTTTWPRHSRRPTWSGLAHWRRMEPRSRDWWGTGAVRCRPRSG